MSDEKKSAIGKTDICTIGQLLTIYTENEIYTLKKFYFNFVRSFMFFRIEFISIYFFVCNLYKTASCHFVNLFLLLYSLVGEYKGMSRQILPITTSDF